MKRCLLLLDVMDITEFNWIWSGKLNPSPIEIIINACRGRKSQKLVATVMMSIKVSRYLSE